MMCDLCGKRPATIYIEHDIVTDRRLKGINGRPRKHKYGMIHICAQCEKDWEKILKEAHGILEAI